MNKRYRVEVTEEVEEETLTSRKWVQGGTVEAGEDWGYTPQVKEVKKINRCIFMQDLADLDLTEVIKAVNKI